MDQGVAWNLPRGTGRAVASLVYHEVCAITSAVSCCFFQPLFPPCENPKWVEAELRKDKAILFHPWKGILGGDGLGDDSP